MSVSLLDGKRRTRFTMETNVVLKHDHPLVGLRHMQPSAWNGVGIVRKWQAPCLDEYSKMKAERIGRRSSSQRMPDGERGIIMAVQYAFHNLTPLAQVTLDKCGHVEARSLTTSTQVKVKRCCPRKQAKMRVQRARACVA